MDIKWDITYFTSNIIEAADDFSQSSNEAFVAKMQLKWFCLYPVSAVQELITISDSAYLD